MEWEGGEVEDDGGHWGRGAHYSVSRWWVLSSAGRLSLQCTAWLRLTRLRLTSTITCLLSHLLSSSLQTNTSLSALLSLSLSPSFHIIEMADMPVISSSSLPPPPSTPSRPPSGKFSIACHGGSGAISSTILRPPYTTSLLSCLHSGYLLLSSGASALDAVTAVVSALESHPLYNAGVGSVFGTDGLHELDASIMSGSTRSCGAVAAVQRIDHPVRLARAVMERTPHCMLIGEGAEALGRLHGEEYGMKEVDNSYFDVKERWTMLNEWRVQQGLSPLTGSGPIRGTGPQSAAAEPTLPLQPAESKYGTVGCVAYDQYGSVAAATSTGGMTGKLPGRVGDSPLIGAGAYADDRSAAVSSTGHGEYFIRCAVAKEVADRLRWTRREGGQGKQSMEEVARSVFEESLETLGEGALGGVICVDREGNIGLHYNTAGMFRAWATEEGTPHVAIFKEEEDTQGVRWSQ